MTSPGDDQPRPLHDYIVVGAGASAMGLLYGLLLPHAAVPHDSMTWSSSSSCPRIAILEQGPESSSEVAPHHWCRTSQNTTTTTTVSQYDDSNNNNNNNKKTLVDPTEHHSTTNNTAVHMRRRCFATPVGHGWGGTTRIHACLCTPPCRTDFSHSNHHNHNNMMMDSIRVIQDAMMAHGALQHVPVTTDQSAAAAEGFAQDESASSVVWPDMYRLLVPTKEEPWREAIFPSIVNGIPTTTAATTTTAQATTTTRQPATKHHRHVVVLRKNYYQALVEPLLAAYPHLQESLTWMGGAQVQRLIFAPNNNNNNNNNNERPRVVGVEYASCECTTTTRNDHGDTRILLARRDVILCAGAIETPALLLTSGIGHAEDLKRLGIPSRVGGSVAGVGRRLRDHVLVPRVVLVPNTVEEDEEEEPLSLSSPTGVSSLCYFRRGENNRFQVLIHDAGVYTHVVPVVAASLLRYRFEKHGKSSSFWNLLLVPCLNGLSSLVSTVVRWTLSLLVNLPPVYNLLRRHAVTMNLALLSPKSYGQVQVQKRTDRHGSGPWRRRDMEVNVNVGYLNDARDIESLWQGYKELSDNLSSNLFPNSRELVPGLFRCVWGGRKHELHKSHPVWFRYYCLGLCVPYFHYCGSCAQKVNGDDNTEWVVDSSLRVRGVSGLRVCDASVFSTPLSGPTALSCSGLGYSLAEMLRTDKVAKLH